MASAIAASFVVTATVATATATVAATTTSTLTGDDIDKSLNLLLSCIVHAQHLTLKHESHARIGVVEVDSYSLILYLYHKAVHALAIGIHEGNDVAGIDLLVIKLTIHAEDILVDVEDKIVTTVSVGFIFSEGKVEGVALLQVFKLILKCLEGEAQTCGKLERLLGGSLLHELALAFKLCIHVVRYDNRLAGIDFCHIVYSKL